MSCVLRIYGTDFDVDDYLAKAGWGEEELRVTYKGEPKSPTGRFGVHEDSGFSACASDAQFEDFHIQQKDTIAFIKKFWPQLKLLSEYKLDRWKCFDFGLSVILPNHYSTTYRVSTELMRLCGELDIQVYMSNYKMGWEPRRRHRLQRKRWPINK